MTSSGLIIAKFIKPVSSGLACSGLIGAGTGIGLVFASLIKAFVVNLRLKNQLFVYAILGFALSKAIGLLALMRLVLFYMRKMSTLLCFYITTENIIFFIKKWLSF
jgi:F0F1-type ATP synthase membrane subunit c/vacuolar-type H+-ATPase subunit K